MEVEEFPKKLLQKCERYLELVKRLQELASENTRLLENVGGSSMEAVEAKQQLLSARDVMKAFALKEQVKIELPPPPKFPVNLDLSTFSAVPGFCANLFQAAVSTTPAKAEGSTARGLFEQRLLGRLVFILWRATQVQKQVAVNRLAANRRPPVADATEKLQRLHDERRAEEARIRTLWQSARDAIDQADLSRMHAVDQRFQGVLREVQTHFTARESHAVEEAKVQVADERVGRGVEALERCRKLRKVRGTRESAETLTVNPSVPLFLDFNEIPQAVKNMEENKHLFVEVFRSFDRLRSEVARPAFSLASLAIRQRARMYVLASVFRAAQDRLKISGLRALELPRRGPQRPQYIQSATDGDLKTTTSLVLDGTAEKHVSVLVRRAPSITFPAPEPAAPARRSPSRAFSFWRSIVDE